MNTHLILISSPLYNYNRAIPCPSGVAAGTCPTGHKCIANTPCHAHGKLPTPNVRSVLHILCIEYLM